MKNFSGRACDLVKLRPGFSASTKHLFRWTAEQKRLGAARSYCSLTLFSFGERKTLYLKLFRKTWKWEWKRFPLVQKD